MSSARPYGSPHWQLLTNGFGSGGGGGITEAPTDGQLYSRQGSTASWVVSPSGGGGGSVAWVDITGKPATFPPTLPIAQSGVTNLVTDLAGKAPTVHTHAQSDITGLTTALAGKEPTIAGGTTAQYWRGDKSWQAFPTTLPPSAHTHVIADVTGLQTALDGKVNKAGDTLTGFLSVHSQPTSNLHVANKAWVDNNFASVAYVNSQVALSVAKAGSTMTGLLVLSADPAAALGAATKQMVDLKAPLASPSLTGTPLAPTAAPGTNTTQIASTAFVVAAMSAAGSVSPSNAIPIMDGTGTAGTSALYAREGHIHPTDTSREATIAAGTTAQYWRGNKTWATLDKAAVGLGNVDNTADTSKPVSTAGAAADALRVLKAGDTMSGALVLWNGALPATSFARQIVSESLVTSQNIGFNAYLNSTASAWLAATTNVSGVQQFSLANNSFHWMFAPSVTAGSTATHVVRLTLDSAGTLTTGAIGNLIAGGNVYANTGSFIGGTANAVLATTGAGQVHLRPNGAGSTAGEVYLTNAGVFSSPVFETRNGVVSSSATSIVVAPTGAGGVYLRPNGSGSTTGETVVTAAGALSASGTVVASSAVRAGVSFYADASYTYLTTATNAYMLYTNATGQFSYNVNALTTFEFRNGGVLFIYNTGAYKPGAGPWYDSSDERIKNIEGEYIKGLDKVLQLRPVVYTFKGNDTTDAPAHGVKNPADAEEIARMADEPLTVPYPNSPHREVAKEQKQFVGMIAQEVEAIFPEMISKRDAYIDGEPVTDLRDMDTGPLIYAVVNSIKALHARLTALEAAAT